MSLLFSYPTLSVTNPVLTLAGRQGRPRPLIRVTLLGPKGVYVRNALLDTGADDTVFPVNAAAAVGIDLTHAPAGGAAGVGGGPVTYRLAFASLRVTDGREFREWTALIGFTTVTLRYPLLGFAGFFQFFSAHFHGDREEVELTVNSLYPGT